ncbi:MAG: trpA [Oscillospiraceae bacterium]|nr:trpA [Oscillospiraceae bacterium]
MNRIDKKFSDLKEQNQKALITFVTAGDPDIKTTEEVILSMLSSGADIVEIGVPFSDPMAEGPVIQAASERALSAGTRLTGIFELVRNLRKKTNEPLLLMMYVNTIFRFGTDKFFLLCNETGIDGVIIPDLPFEEQDEFKDIADSYGIHTINLVAPTSKDRIQMIAQNSHGFLYCVSSTGVTGTRASFSTDFDEFFGEIKKYSKIPYAVGFGISGPDQARVIKEYCDGVIVGSAIVQIVGEHGKNATKYVGDFVKSLKTALSE